MIFFKNYKLFEADESKPEQKPEDKKEGQEGQEGQTTAPTFNKTFTFKNTFNYNKIDINDSFEKTMGDAIAELDKFMKEENKNNVINVIQINASGFASWVPTRYKNKVYAVNNNNTLANDRAASIAEEVKKRITKYFNDKGIKKLNFEKSELKGSIDYKNSKQVFSDYIKKNYNAKSLVAEINNIKPQGPKEIKFVKDVTKVQNPEKYLNVNDYATKYADNVVTLKTDDANAEQVYQNMLKTPMYVLYTSHLKANNGVETTYRNSTQYATVEILINEENLIQPPTKNEPQTNELKQISFEKDVDKPDADGQAAIKILVDYLTKTPVDQIKNLILIGHAEGDDELNPPKIKFDPNNQEKLKQNEAGAAGTSGQAKQIKTIMTEAQLADLRFVLSIARSKTVYRAIANLDTVKKLIEKKALWLLPSGTLFGDQLAASPSKNQRIVQVVVQKTDSKVINTTPEVSYGTEFKDPTLTKINAYVKELNYNFGKLISKVLNPADFGSPVPNHIELAKDPNKLANFHNDLF